jgi:putative ABC transport system ATP-binding protein
MIALRDVTKTYRIGDASLAAISGVDLEIPKGEFVAVMGPSGSGKSTLLFTIGGLLAPTSGDVQVGSKSIYKLTRKERARFIRANMGFVFQSFELLPYLTALENVAVALYLSDVHHSKHQAMANEALERVGLRGRASHRPS